MGENFVEATVAEAAGVKSPWRILQPPTGTGKTQGTCVYAAMQAEQNLATEGNLKPVGILIVTRLKSEADYLRDTINKLAGQSIAIANHSGSRATAEELHESDVVVITHQAFTNAQRDLKDEHWKPWDRLKSWRGGQRLLTIIDESLANVVDESHVTAENLAFVCNLLTPDIRTSYPVHVAMIEQVHQVLLAYAAQDDVDNSMSLIWNGGNVAPLDFAPLVSELSRLPFDRIVYGHNNSKKREDVAARVVKAIKAVETCLKQFAYYAKEGAWHSINSASLAIPLDTPGPVVLDGTARVNFLWDLFEDRHVRPPIPSHTRDYSSVRLHVARAKGLGKNTMTARIRERLPRVRRAIEDAVGTDRSVFVCAHKDVEDYINKKWVKTSKFKELSVGHWNAVDGRNTWQDCDTAVIVGLPYRSQTWATNVFCALQGSQDDAWLKSPQWKQYKNVRREMEQRQMSVSIIQAINRIQCRHVIDEEGHCPLADIFIILPEDAMGTAILDDIRADMPGLDVRVWDFSLDPPKEKKPRIGSSHERLIKYMIAQPAGTVSLSDVQHDLRLTSVKKLRETLNRADHPTTLALSDHGVKYIPGIGRGSKSFLVKAAA